MANIIEVKDLDLTLGKTDILKKINVSFEEGKIHRLIGRNVLNLTTKNRAIIFYQYCSK